MVNHKFFLYVCESPFSVLLIYVSVSVPVLCYFDYPSFVLKKNLQLGSMIPPVLLFLKIVLAILGLSCFLANLQLLVLVL